MKLSTHLTKALCMPFACALLLLGSAFSASAVSKTRIVDDFSHPADNSLGIPRQFFSDKMAGGNTEADSDITNGILTVKGDILPPRGQPGWASTVLLLDSAGQPEDLSAFSGVRLMVKVIEGTFSVSANSTEITNFDYHAAPVLVAADGQFHEVKIPFTAMKRAWSEQTALNKSTINSLSIVAFGLRPVSFEMALDEVGFY